MIGEVLLTTISGHFRLLQCDQILLELGDIVMRRNASTGQQVLKGQPGHIRQRGGPRQRQTVLLEEKNRQLALELRRRPPHANQFFCCGWFMPSASPFMIEDPISSGFERCIQRRVR